MPLQQRGTIDVLHILRCLRSRLRSVNRTKVCCCQKGFTLEDYWGGKGRPFSLQVSAVNFLLTQPPLISIHCFPMLVKRPTTKRANNCLCTLCCNTHICVSWDLCGTKQGTPIIVCAFSLPSFGWPTSENKGGLRIGNQQLPILKACWTSSYSLK